MDDETYEKWVILRMQAAENYLLCAKHCREHPEEVQALKWLVGENI